MANVKDTDVSQGEARDDEDRSFGAWARRALARKHGALPPASDLDDDLLLRYVDGALDKSERASLELRLLTDLDAKERVGILAGALHESGYPAPLPPEGVLVRSTKAARYVFHIAAGVFEVLRGQGVSVLAADMTVRSGQYPALGSAGHAIAYQIERDFVTAQGNFAARFELHAERADSTALVDLVVHVGTEGHAATGVRCKLLRDGRPIDSREIEETGCTFSHLDPARYDLELRKGGVEVGRLLLDLRG